MTTGAIVVRWGQNVPGREAKGLEVFGNALALCERYAKEGRIHGHKEYFNVTGTDGGFQVIDGELDQLAQIVVDDEFRRVCAEASAVVTDFDVELCQGGTDASVQDGTTRYVAAMQALGYWSG